MYSAVHVQQLYKQASKALIFIYYIKLKELKSPTLKLRSE